MFSGTAAGHMMPVYTVYKSGHLYPGWLDGGEKQWRYNSTSSGWFDQVTFEDWLEKIIVPYCRQSRQKVNNWRQSGFTSISTSSSNVSRK